MVADGRTMHGGTYNSNPLVCAAVIAAARATGAEGFYEGLDARGPGSPTGSSPPPMMPGSKPAGAEPARCSSSGSLGPAPRLPRGPRRDRLQPVRHVHADLRERGILIQPPQEGLVPDIGRPYRRRHRPHARGGGECDARSGGAPSGAMSAPGEESDEAHRAALAALAAVVFAAGCGGSGHIAGAAPAAHP